MEVGIHHYLDFSLFISRLKYQGLWSKERGKCWNFKVVLHIANYIEGKCIIWNREWDAAALAKRVFWSSNHSSENFSNRKQL